MSNRVLREGTDLDSLVAAETVELVQELKHRPLHLTVTALLRIEPLGADSVQLVDEDDGWCLLLRELERVTDELRAVADVHLHERRAREFEVARVRLRRARSGHERLAGSCVGGRA